MTRIAGIVYLVIGVVVASAQGYLGNISNVADFVNLLLAVTLWPLLLVGVDFNLSFGGGKGGTKKGALFLLNPALVYAQSAPQFRRR